MKKFIFSFSFIFFSFLFFSSSVSAQQVTPDGHYNTQLGYTNNYCIGIYDILHEKDIYTCTIIGASFYSKANTSQSIYEGNYSLCWQGSWAWNAQSRDSNLPGIVLSKKISISDTLPSNYATPCKLKKPENPIACSQPIDVARLVQGAFWNKFPMDLLTNFSSSPPPTACPSFTVRGQTFQLCYLNKLTASLKYVLLVIFIISSVIAL